MCHSIEVTGHTPSWLQYEVPNYVADHVSKSYWVHIDSITKNTPLSKDNNKDSAARSGGIEHKEDITGRWTAVGSNGKRRYRGVGSGAVLRSIGCARGLKTAGGDDVFRPLGSSGKRQYRGAGSRAILRHIGRARGPKTAWGEVKNAAMPFTASLVSWEAPGSGGIRGREAGPYCEASGEREGRKRRGGTVHRVLGSAPKRWEAAASEGGKRGGIAAHQAGQSVGNDGGDGGAAARKELAWKAKQCFKAQKHAGTSFAQDILRAWGQRIDGELPFWERWESTATRQPGAGSKRGSGRSKLPQKYAFVQ
ncbi:hypothetical protein B0H19DRAFT_1065825 [Mycena capillaripes]|nr:hypothetical protein B0H19DRAFT_1065825 [Mycena capillaripes]